MRKVIILGALLIFVLTGCTILGDEDVAGVKVLSMEEATAKADEFINNNLMPAGQKATIKEVVEEYGLYKIVVDAGSGQDINSYMTKDGKTFFPQAMDIEEIESASVGGDEQGPVSEVTNKKDKPKVELFVMSHCPYGTQIEKGILPVLETLGDKIDFELKFCSYAMHDKKELDEQLRQYCIQKEQPDKFLSYLKCFLEDDNYERCLKEVNINTTNLNSCVTAADKEFKVTELYNDKSTWSGGRYPLFNVYKNDNTKYGVQGSPTLVINGERISSDRDAASLLSTICSGFNSQPEECQTELSAVTPAPGFGFEGSGSGASGECN